MKILNFGIRRFEWKPIQDDLENAGARYSDASVIVDDNLISSRTPNDLPDFCKAILKILAHL